MINTPCTKFSGYIHPAHGYGTLWLNGRMMRAHRAAYEKAHGYEVPSHVYVLHTCDNKACINPDHLYLGDAKMNKEDCIARGRDTTKDQRFGRKLSKNNTSGTKGVSFDKLKWSWKASIRVGAKRYQARFEQLADAIAWRKQKEQELWTP